MVDAIRCDCGQVITAGPTRGVIFTTSQHLQKSDCGPDDWDAATAKSRRMADEQAPELLPEDAIPDTDPDPYDGSTEATDNPMFQMPQMSDNDGEDGSSVDTIDCPRCDEEAEKVENSGEVYATDKHGNRIEVRYEKGDYACPTCNALTDGKQVVTVPSEVL